MRSLGRFLYFSLPSSVSPTPLILASAHVFSPFVSLLSITLSSLCSKHTECYHRKCNENRILIETMMAMLKTQATLWICHFVIENQYELQDNNAGDGYFMSKKEKKNTKKQLSHPLWMIMVSTVFLFSFEE